MTRYAVALDKTDDLIIEDPHLSLDLTPGWAVFTDPHGTCLAIPTNRVRSIQRLDQMPQDAANPAIEDARR